MHINHYINLGFTSTINSFKMLNAFLPSCFKIQAIKQVKLIDLNLKVTLRKSRKNDFKIIQQRTLLQSIRS
jgi:hypothetical protein